MNVRIVEPAAFLMCNKYSALFGSNFWNAFAAAQRSLFDRSGFPDAIAFA
jgi:hypothetical protein